MKNTYNISKFGPVVVCGETKEQLWNKSVTTDKQLEKQNKQNEYYGLEPTDAEHCSRRKLANCFVKIAVPEESQYELFDCIGKLKDFIKESINELYFENNGKAACHEFMKFKTAEDGLDALMKTEKVVDLAYKRYLKQKEGDTHYDRERKE